MPTPARPRPRIIPPEEALEKAAAAVGDRLLMLGLDPRSKAAADLVRTVLAVGGAYLNPVQGAVPGPGRKRTDSAHMV